MSLNENLKKIVGARYCEPPAVALARWQPDIKAKQASGENINIFSTIGEYGDGAGMTAKIVSAVLRKADGAPVTVNINSPGGDFFEGLAIHTLLSEYEGEVNTRVVGMAASAASLVALAGDDITIAKAGFFMIHNAWTIAIGNKAAMRQVADMLDQFDTAALQLYADSTGLEPTKLARMLADETWIGGEEAVTLGFASSILGEDKIEHAEDDDAPAHAAVRMLDATLAKAGMPRSERRRLLKEISGKHTAAGEDDTPNAVEDATLDAGELGMALAGLLTTLQPTTVHP